MRDWLHHLVHRHWPLWEARDYDFLTWRWRCRVCLLRHTATITRLDG